MDVRKLLEADDDGAAGSSEEHAVLMFFRKAHAEAPWLPLDEHEKVSVRQTRREKESLVSQLRF